VYQADPPDDAERILRVGAADPPQAIEARGDDRVRSVTLTTTTGVRTQFEVDRLLLDWGRVPATELALGLGATAHFDSHVQMFVPDRDDRLRLSIPGVYLVYTAAEGSFAGRSAAVDLGLRPDAPPPVRIAKQASPVPDLLAYVTPDTVICRCENVRLRDLQQNLLAGAADPNWIKGPTRAAMGVCLGRECETIVSLAFAQMQHAAPRPLTVRPPFRAIPISAVAREMPLPEHIQPIKGT
jgi:hypothetical protein